MLVLVIMRVTATSLRVGLPRARERLAAISAVATACTAPRRGIAATAVDARRHDAYRLFRQINAHTQAIVKVKEEATLVGCGEAIEEATIVAG